MIKVIKRVYEKKIEMIRKVLREVIRKYIQKKGIVKVS